MTSLDLNSTEFNKYYARYINKLSVETTLKEAFVNGKQNVVSFFKLIPLEKLEYRYKPNKWTIKEVLQHLIDTERIFMYRCFRIARRDKTALAGFEQNDYIVPSRANHKTLDNLLKEFEINRLNSLTLLEFLSLEDLKFMGNSNGSKMSARAAAFVIPGHNIWHINIIKERYL